MSCKNSCCNVRPLSQYVDLHRYKSLYENFHAHPELSNQESWTAKTIQSVLSPLQGCEIFTGIGGHGLVAVFRNGPGKTILLRADMDGLPLKEQTGLPYASQMRMVDTADNAEKPVMHACGHDVHMTCLIAATETLVTHLGRQWSGTLITLYQPAEERGTGAVAMVEDGLYERIPRPDILLGQHVVSSLPAGHIGLKPGVIMAAADSMRCKLIGRGGHASQPHRAIDTGLLAANVVTSLQQIVSREVRPDETVVVSAIPLSAGVAENIIPSEIEIGIDVRSMDSAMRLRVLKAVNRIIDAQCKSVGIEQAPELRRTRTFPLTENAVNATLYLQSTFKETFGDEFDPSLRPSTIAEDFPNLAQGKPYIFWHLGGGDATRFDLDGYATDKPAVPMNHTAEFSPVVSETLSAGIHALVVAALAFFNQESNNPLETSTSKL